MWDMIDDVTSTVGSVFTYGREIAERELMKESAKTSAVEALLKRPDIQKKILVEVEKDLLKEFGIKNARNNIIDFSGVETKEDEGTAT